jgi:phosphorylase/glycogen(starch) synthase
MVASDFARAREMAFWKKRLRREWPHLEVISLSKPDDAKGSLTLGKKFNAELVIAIGELNPEDLGVELVVATKNQKGELRIRNSFEFKTTSFENGVATYSANVVPGMAGSFHIAMRIYAKNDKMPHRQDFELVKWL